MTSTADLAPLAEPPDLHRRKPKTTVPPLACDTHANVFGQATMRFASAVMVLLFASTAFAQVYPSRPIRLVAPGSPGGNVDLTARILGPGLAEILGQPVVVENRGGAGGVIAFSIVLKAPPDGYTLMIGTSSTLSVGPNVSKNWPVDPTKGLTPISYVHEAPFVLVTGPKSPFRNVDDLVRQARAAPGALNLAHAGDGTSNHMVGELFQMLTGAKFLQIPYKGAGPARTSVMSGETVGFFDQLNTSIGPGQAGQIRLLAVTSAKRLSLLPDVPTFKEAGIEGFEVTNFTGLVGPPGLKSALVKQLNEAVLKLLRDPKVQERLLGLGVAIVGSSPEQFGAVIQADLERWAKVAKVTGVSVDFEK